MLVSDAVAQMAAKDYGAIVIVNEQDHVDGMVTERDILKRLVAQGRRADETRVGEIMSTGIRVAREDERVVDWLRIMSNERFRRLPIVDEEGRVQAIMTQGDFVSYTWPDLLGQVGEFTRSTVSRNSQIFMIFGAVLLYTALLAVIFGAL